MISFPKPPAIITPPAPITKRRRRSGKGQGDSSREASAESNDETATDNDPMADDTDTASMTSPRTAGTQFRHRTNFEESRPPPAPPHRHKRPQSLAATATMISGMAMLGTKDSSSAVHLDGISNDTSLESGIESGTSTYDGDVSSAPGGSASKRGIHNQKHPPNNALRQSDASSQSRKGSLPGSSLSQMSWAHEGQDQPTDQTSTSAGKSHSTPRLQPPGKSIHSNLPPAPHGLLSRVAPEELQAKMQEAILNSVTQRSYVINPPPTDRPVRIYADGVYDLFHYGHALQLRQCKLFFPEVYLMVGVCSDELVKKFKSSPVLNSSERYESVRNCKWVDEVIEDAPWQVDHEFIEKHGIDYVAHDEEPYKSVDSDDVYAYAKSQGKFLPTRRTDGVSTSELLQRIVGGYIEGVYDNKLEKIGVPELCSNRAFSDHSGSGLNKSVGGGVGTGGGAGTGFGGGKGGGSVGNGGGFKTPVIAGSPRGETVTGSGGLSGVGGCGNGIGTDAEMDDGTHTANEGS